MRYLKCMELARVVINDPPRWSNQVRDVFRRVARATMKTSAHNHKRTKLFGLAMTMSALAVFLSAAVNAQVCTGNTRGGCTHPGAACSLGGGQFGHCKTTAAPPGERECECVEGTTTQPPVVLNPKYLVLGLVYAPPGCSNIPGSQCANAASLVDYAGGSSLGSKVSTKDSFKGENKVSVDIAGAWGFDAGFSVTDANGSSVAITKSAALDIKALGNGDGVDHGQDQFILLLNPKVTLRKQGVNLYWSPGYDGPFLDRYEVYVSELRRPSTMRPAVAAELKRLGFTTDDFQHILSLDPFGGTVCTESRFPDALSCGPQVATDGRGPALDSNRFAPTAWSFPYEPPLQSESCNNGVCNCTIFSGTLKNETVLENSSESTTEYSVGFHASAPLSDVFGLKASGQLTWTSTATQTSTTGSSQSATATISCPSPSYTGPLHMALFWDKLWGSFLFMPYDASASSAVHRGQVINASGKPVRGQLVHLAYGGKTFHTVTGRNGNYEFFAPAGRIATATTAQLTVGNVRRMINLGSPGAIITRVQ